MLAWYLLYNPRAQQLEIALHVAVRHGRGGVMHTVASRVHLWHTTCPPSLMFSLEPLVVPVAVLVCVERQIMDTEFLILDWLLKPECRVRWWLAKVEAETR
mmetsp:Transcript_18108/g.50417  ORF Transcript_18108/g.50417 Transcript_18108/m.50417 type:complete len:101 (+) Transcript_18108:796-1098(+)|eukprot:scaffold38245_cov33-Tisochrysis_lutea.AAC.3